VQKNADESSVCVCVLVCVHTYVLYLNSLKIIQVAYSVKQIISKNTSNNYGLISVVKGNGITSLGSLRNEYSCLWTC